MWEKGKKIQIKTKTEFIDSSAHWENEEDEGAEVEAKKKKRETHK